MKPAVRRPLLVTIVLAVAVLVATTVTGAASAAGLQKETTAAVLPAATQVPAGRVQALVTPSVSSSPMSESMSAAGRALARNRPPCASGVRACVSLSDRKAWLLDGNGRVVYGPVSVLGGRRGEPTPVGTFTVSNKVRNYHSRQFDAPMPYSVFFYPGVAFHTGSLTTRSAGCLHLGSTSAQRFFSTLSSGDRVQVVS